MDAATATTLLSQAGVLDHVTTTLSRLLAGGGGDAMLDRFEAVSTSVKASKALTPADLEFDDRARAAASREAARDASLFAQPAPNEDDDAKRAGATGDAYNVQNFCADATLLEWGGVAFGRIGTFKLHLALRQLSAARPSLRAVRFWGVLRGTDADYIIAESIASGDDEPLFDGHGGTGVPGDLGGAALAAGARDGLGHTVQPTGEGPNRLTYFVTRKLGEPWTRLPPVTPHQVRVARRIRRYVTGDLGAPVGGHPPFPGAERNFVRALIALISAATRVAPAGSVSLEDGAEDDGTGALRSVPQIERDDALDLRELT